MKSEKWRIHYLNKLSLLFVFTLHFLRVKVL